MKKLTSTCVALTTCMGSIAASQSLQWTPDEILNVKKISEVQVSPDNRKLAFAVVESQCEEDKNRFFSRLFQVETSGNGMPMPIECNELSCTLPRYSPDGKWIAFIAVKDEVRQLCVVPAEGGEVKTLTEGKKPVQIFRWSPDSTRIAFVRAEDLSCPKLDQSLEAVEYMKPNFAQRLWIVSLQEGQAVALTEDEYFVRGSGDFNGYFEEFDWSPDGEEITFSYSPGPGHDFYHLDSSLATVKVDNRSVERWEKNNTYEAIPRYSPDGKWIAYLCADSEMTYTLDRYVAIRSRNDQSFIRLSPTYNEGSYLAGPNLLGWSSDSQDVLFFEPKGTRFQLYALPINGDLPAHVDTGDFYFAQVGLSPDTTTLGLVIESPSQPPEVFVSSLEEFAPKKLTSVNERFLSFPMPKTEVVSWTSLDGEKIEGLLTYPIGYQEGKQYPMLLVIHGGPMGFFTESYIASPWVYPLVSFAEAGYFVFRPNPRGSSGYGRVFRSANVGDWGGMDYHDLMSGVDMLIGKGIADSSKLGIMGWSYGGYMTSWAISQTMRFKAASIGAAPINLWSMAGTTDLYHFLDSYMGDFWDHAMLYQERSPLFHVGNIMTPCLIQHGVNDLRVPVSQAYELYHALKRKDKEVVLYLYPQTGHAFTKPLLQKDCLEKNIAWFLQKMNE